MKDKKMNSADLQLYEDELSNYTTDALNKIKQRGYWKVLIRPSRVSKQRIPSVEVLDKMVEEYPSYAAKQNLDSSFPIYPSKATAMPEQNCVGQSDNIIGVMTDWRLYQSGQFVCYFRMKEDWASPSSSSSPNIKTLEYSLLEFYFKQIFTFAQNLVENPEYNTDVVITIEAHDTLNRHLDVDKDKDISSYITDSLRWLIKGRNQPFRLPTLTYHAFFDAPEFAEQPDQFVRRAIVRLLPQYM
jgi:hypothetical protein